MTKGSFRFVHAADLHLDTPFEGLRKLAPDVAQMLRDASLDAFDNLVQLVLDVEAKFLLLAGDLYDGIERGIRAQLRFHRGLERLSAHGIHVFIVHGNHDPLQGWSAIKQWPELVTVFPAHRLEQVPVVENGELLATIYGISYAGAETAENLALRFKRGSAPGLHIGLLHADMTPAQEHSRYSPCSAADLQAAAMDYWALGHQHLRQIVHSGSPWICYPGNLQGRSPKPSELGPKGAFVVEVQDSQVAAVDFRPCDAIRFVPLDFDISECQELNELRQNLIRRSEALQQEHQGRGLILRARLQGRGPLHQELRHPSAAGDLLLALREESAGSASLLWWESIADSSHPLLDLQAVDARQDFAAELLSLVRQYLQQEPAQLSFVDQKLRRVLPNRIWRLLPLLESELAKPELFEQAGLLALELLEEEL